jgi:hypothetical protein
LRYSIKPRRLRRPHLPFYPGHGLQSELHHENGNHNGQQRQNDRWCRAALFGFVVHGLDRHELGLSTEVFGALILRYSALYLAKMVCDARMCHKVDSTHTCASDLGEADERLSSRQLRYFDVYLRSLAFFAPDIHFELVAIKETQTLVHVADADPPAVHLGKPFR